MPPPTSPLPLSTIVTLSMYSAGLPAVGLNHTANGVPVPLTPVMWTFSRCSALPARNLMPYRPVPMPLIDRLRRMTTSLAPALTITPVVPVLEIPPATPSQLMVIDLVMVTVPKPPGSRQSISPLAAVLEIAPAKVLHGAVRLHGLTSSPTPDTHVRGAWANAVPWSRNRTRPANSQRGRRSLRCIIWYVSPMVDCVSANGQNPHQRTRGVKPITRSRGAN